MVNWIKSSERPLLLTTPQLHDYFACLLFHTACFEHKHNECNVSTSWKEKNLHDNLSSNLKTFFPQVCSAFFTPTSLAAHTYDEITFYYFHCSCSFCGSCDDNSIFIFSKDFFLAFPHFLFTFHHIKKRNKSF